MGENPIVTVHIVGGGLSGLRCALTLSASLSKDEIVVYEGSGRFGGRAVSFYDETLQTLINNGTHLLLRSNRSVLSMAEETGGIDHLIALPCQFSFIEFPEKQRWVISPNRGSVPWWVLFPSRRVPQTSPWDYAIFARLMAAGSEETVADVAKASPLFTRLVVPLCEAILNTPAHEASARLLGSTLAQTLGKGAQACQPMLAAGGLSRCLIEPTVERLQQKGISLRLHSPIRRLESENGRVVALHLKNGDVHPIKENDQIVIATDNKRAHDLLKESIPLLRNESIINVHFLSPYPSQSPFFCGFIGGYGQWLAVMDGVLSVTLSGSSFLQQGISPDQAVPQIWQEVVQALRWSPSLPLPPVRIVHEKRATLHQSPAAYGRPILKGRLPRNVVVAGDWTVSTLPCTMESAVQSGEEAARAVLRALHSL